MAAGPSETKWLRWWGGWLVGFGLAVWLIGFCWLVGWLPGWLVGWLVFWSAGWLIGWLAGWLVGWSETAFSGFKIAFMDFR